MSAVTERDQRYIPPARWSKTVKTLPKRACSVFGEMQRVGEERSVTLRVMVIGHDWTFSQAMSRQTPVTWMPRLTKDMLKEPMM